jgi:hypothetical protein
LAVAPDAADLYRLSLVKTQCPPAATRRARRDKKGPDDSRDTRSLRKRLPSTLVPNQSSGRKDTQFDDPNTPGRK